MSRSEEKIDILNKTGILNVNMRSKAFIIGVMMSWLVGCWGACLGHASVDVHMAEHRLMPDSDHAHAGAHFASQHTHDTHDPRHKSLPFEDGQCDISAAPSGSVSLQFVPTAEALPVRISASSPKDRARWEFLSSLAPPGQSDSFVESHPNKAPPQHS
jgi:hypothetical protein